MRKIDKTLRLSTEYMAWEAAFEQREANHPPYTSSNFRFYLDIVMNLLHCQQGLCAYTEMRLCQPDAFEPEHWKDGRYTIEAPEFFGHLEHFDKTLKEHKAWLWSNLFMVDSDVNTKIKGKQTVDLILKPDSPAYDAFRLLEYDIQTHFFIANTDLPEDERQRVTSMIDTLGINFGPVRTRRAVCLTRQLKMIEFGLITWDDAPDEFITSYEMCKRDRT